MRLLFRSFAANPAAIAIAAMGCAVIFALMISDWDLLPYVLDLSAFLLIHQLVGVNEYVSAACCIAMMLLFATVRIHWIVVFILAVLWGLSIIFWVTQDGHN